MHPRPITENHLLEAGQSLPEDVTPSPEKKSSILIPPPPSHDVVYYLFFNSCRRLHLKPLMLLQLIAWKTIICSNDLAALASSVKGIFSKQKTDLKLFPLQSIYPPPTPLQPRRNGEGGGGGSEYFQTQAAHDLQGTPCTSCCHAYVSSSHQDSLPSSKFLGQYVGNSVILRYFFEFRGPVQRCGSGWKCMHGVIQ